MNNPNIIFWNGRTLKKDVFIRAKAENTQLIVQYNVTKNETTIQDFSRFRTMLDSFVVIGKPAGQTLLFCFDGYDYDKRSLAEIPEVVTYIKRVVELYPQLWYFLIPGEANSHVFVSLVSWTMYSSSLFPKIPNAPGIPPNERKLVQLDIPTADKLMESLETDVMKYGISIGDERGARVVVQQWRNTLNL